MHDVNPHKEGGNEDLDYDWSLRSERIRHAFDTSPLSYIRLTNALGVSKTTLYRWIKRPNNAVLNDLERLEKIALLTNKSLPWIVWGIGKKEYTHTTGENEYLLMDIFRQLPDVAQMSLCDFAAMLLSNKD